MERPRECRHVPLTLPNGRVECGACGIPLRLSISPWVQRAMEHRLPLKVDWHLR